MLFGQRTVGLITYEEQASPGYNLYFPLNQSNLYLLDNCGQVVHTWPSPNTRRPGNTAYLLPDGNMVMTTRHFFSNNDPIWAGGGGESVEIRTWDNDTLWTFTLNDSLRRLHHDIAPMPNGNILMIAWEFKSNEEALQAGRNPALMELPKLWPDYLLEVNPQTNEVVWEWHAWDHLVQDFDATKDNFGNVGQHPELIDLNFDTNAGNPDWLHSNAIAYNPALDQVALSVPQFNEVWIIDHSTTTEEAASHQGGRSGRGGDLLFRWGNPLAYRAGTAADQQLFFNHDVHWIGEFADPAHPHVGKLMVFNNQVGENYSSVEIINPVFDTLSGQYLMANGRWLPEQPDQTITHPDPTRLYSDVTSSARLLPNGNLLICAGRPGYTFEMTPDNEVVWEYVNPFSGGNALAQGSTPVNNIMFNVVRYPENYPAFDGRTLAPSGFLELNPDPVFCTLVDVVELPNTPSNWTAYPNPTGNALFIQWQNDAPGDLQVIDLMGRPIQDVKAGTGNPLQLNVSAWAPGMYLIKDGKGQTMKILVTRP